VTLAIVSAATALLLLDVTIVNVALPAIADDLSARFAELQWVIDAYALTLASTLLAIGSLADRHGRRRVFCGGLMLFTAASAACALAPSAVWLDVLRGVQGVGAAAIFAPALALLAAAYPAGAARARALTIWGAITGGALAVGPLVGGALVDGLSWEWAFWINLPLGGGLALLAWRRIPESRDPAAAPTDWPGAALFTAGAFLLVLALIGDIEWAYAAAAAALGVFAWLELRTRAPMLDLRLFGIPAFSGTALVAFAQSFALYPLFLFLAIYLQGDLGFSPFETGLRLLPVTLVLFAVAPLSGRMTSRMPLRVPMCLGLALIGIGTLLMRRVTPGGEWTALLPGFVVGGLGIGTISPALAAAMVSVLPVERSGLASGINNTFRQLGIAVGIAVLGAIFTAGAPGLDRVFLCGGLVALASVAPAWWLLGGLHNQETKRVPSSLS
jgi:EmrB/QacA subfamily drug resistance transporter